jgi:hypothetical protein
MDVDEDKLDARIGEGVENAPDDLDIRAYPTLDIRELREWQDSEILSHEDLAGQPLGVAGVASFLPTRFQEGEYHRTYEEEEEDKDNSAELDDWAETWNYHDLFLRGVQDERLFER